MKNKLNKQGFTLAELLIVVAIIAVLVAISIPIFSSKLEASRESTDAAAANCLLLGKTDDEAGTGDTPANAIGDGPYYYTKGGKIVSDGSKAIKGKSAIAGIQGVEVDDLPDGVYLAYLDSVTETVDAENTESTTKTPKDGVIHVILNPNSTDNREIIVYFGVTPE